MFPIRCWNHTNSTAFSIIAIRGSLDHMSKHHLLNIWDLLEKQTCSFCHLANIAWHTCFACTKQNIFFEFFQTLPWKQYLLWPNQKKQISRFGKKRFIMALGNETFWSLQIRYFRSGWYRRVFTKLFKILIVYSSVCAEQNCRLVCKLEQLNMDLIGCSNLHCAIKSFWKLKNSSIFYTVYIIIHKLRKNILVKHFGLQPSPGRLFLINFPCACIYIK